MRGIEITVGVCGGRPRIAGHRIRVMDIAVCHEQGMSSGEIASFYPSITLVDIHAALAYYIDHRDAYKNGPDPNEMNGTIEFL